MADGMGPSVAVRSDDDSFDKRLQFLEKEEDTLFRLYQDARVKCTARLRKFQQAQTDYKSAFDKAKRLLDDLARNRSRQEQLLRLGDKK